jgi:asparagine synthase (glutamine-hydrolysing)
MVGAGGACVVAFNGEIYNFQVLRDELRAKGVTFRSQSDTEVLLESYLAWGISCLDRIEGMFAIAIFDAARGTLYLARDRAGEKPLYFRNQGHRLVFASELKALLEDHSLSRVVDPYSLEHYLAYGYSPAGSSMIGGVEKLLPGCAMEWSVESGLKKVWRYWDLPIPGTACGSLVEAVSRCETLLFESVRNRLVADVPVGVLLSGGVDSSLVAAVAARVSSAPIRTFTVTFPGHGKYDESAYAAVVANYVGAVHTELVAERPDEAMLSLLARQFDDPIADHSIIPTFQVCKLLREHVTVALGGDGADELFGGYPHYSFVRVASLIRSVLPPALRSVLSRAGQRLPPGVRGRNHVIGMSGSLESSLAHINIYFDASLRARLLGRMAKDRPEDHRKREAHELLKFGGLQAATRLDFSGSMSEDYLVKVDRASMLSSLEVRAPFLDRAIIEFAFACLPDEMRVQGSARKIVLRKLVQRLVPIEANWSRKQGFSMPLGSWMRDSLGDYLRAVLTGSNATFSGAEIDRLFREHDRGRDNSSRIFALAMFELWKRHYSVSA